MFILQTVSPNVYAAPRGRVDQIINAPVPEPPARVVPAPQPGFFQRLWNTRPDPNFFLMPGFIPLPSRPGPGNIGPLA